MPSQTIDVIVLGAGIVGVSAALALQERGRAVAIVDRLGEAAGETSFGNSGIVQSEAVIPYLFPRKPREIVRAALNRDPRAHIRYGALPSIAPALWRYFLASTDAGKTETAKAMAALVGGAGAEHRKLAAAVGRRRAASRDRLGQGLAQRARRGAGARGDRGTEALGRLAGPARPRGAHRARAACRRGGDRRRPFTPTR